jgi:molecular chaperone DnaJ
LADDYYQLLGVSRNATADEIKRAYLRQAKELHPDANGGDAGAEEGFKAVNLAYETLRDPERRRQYDMFGATGARGSGGGGAPGDPFGFGSAAGGGGLGDIFDAFFGGNSPFGGGGGGGRRGPTAGEDAETVLTFDLAEAVFGVTRDLTVQLPTTCATCNGSGARPGTTPVTCSVCQGAGEVRRVRPSVFGQMVTASPCTRCGGTGEEITSPCPDCGGQGRRRQERTLTVEVPAGVDDGTTMRISGRGASGLRGGPPGDVYVHLRVNPDPNVTRDGWDLHGQVHVSMTQAALGVNLSYETLDGPEELAIHGGTQSGRQIRLRGKGVPHLQARGRGDFIVTVVVDTPTELTKSQEELLRQLAAEREEEVAPPESGLLSKLRGAFK